MRAPAVAGGEDEDPRAILDRIVGPIAMDGLRRGDARRLAAVVRGHEASDERAIVQRDRLRVEQPSERVVGRIARTGRTDLAGVAALAIAAAVVGHRVLRLRRGPERNAALLRPRLQLPQIPRQRHRRPSDRAPSAGPPERARFARDADAPLGFAIVPLELGPCRSANRRRDRTSTCSRKSSSEKRLHDAAPMQRRSTHGHRARDDAGRGLILDRRRRATRFRRIASERCAIAAMRFSVSNSRSPASTTMIDAPGRSSAASAPGARPKCRRR